MVIYRFLWLILLCLPLQLSAKQKVLIIESYHSEYTWDKRYIDGIKSVLKDDYELIYFQMDTKRLPKTAYQEQSDKAWLYYQNSNPDLVIIADDNALNYLAQRFSQTVTPIIYLGINNNPRNYNIHKIKNITGVIERPLIKRSISTVAQLFPQKINNILLMFDNSMTGKIILDEVFSNKKQIIISGIKVEISLISSWENWQSELLNTADNFDLVFLGLFHTLIDKNNKHIPAEKVLQWSARNTPIPPFAFWDFAIGQDKAIGGLVHFGYDQGKIAAEMAKEVLITGQSPYLLNTKTADKGHYVFSRDGLQKFGLSLPKNIARKTTYID